MKNYIDVIGIDVSKLTIDAYLHYKGKHLKFSNTPIGYKTLILWAEKYLEASLYFLCFENTGHYSNNLGSLL